jgi:uncharacterized repeat protein (TIGR03803 family)
MTKTSLCRVICVIVVLWAATTIAAPAQTFNTLLNFNWFNGAFPTEPLVQGRDGNFYGTTQDGGAYNGGTVFKVTPLGLKTLYSFCAQANCVDGDEPITGLVLGTDGNLYGTTIYGGADWGSTECPSGCGTVFRITPTGTLTQLYAFCAQAKCPDGEQPWAIPVQGTNGNFYGTTIYGGVNTKSCPAGCGTVYEVTPQGTFTTLYSFGGIDGAQPGGLMQASNGNIYGTTAYGGADQSGTIFKVTPTGKVKNIYTVSCTQTNCANGAGPGALVEGSDGKLYGTMYTEGLDPICCGTFFSFAEPGVLTTLHVFNGDDGEYPAGHMILATDGNFYDTTQLGGLTSNNGGTIFRVTPSGVLTSLYGFCSPNCGGSLPGGLLQATNGTLYGETDEGSGRVYGTLYSLDVGLGPFVTFVRGYGKAGQTATILGQGFTGTTDVSFNGTAANFTVISDTYLKAVVPSGATTGAVTVAAPNGMLTSNVPFRVQP